MKKVLLVFLVGFALNSATAAYSSCNYLTTDCADIADCAEGDQRVAVYIARMFDAIQAPEVEQNIFLEMSNDNKIAPEFVLWATAMCGPADQALRARAIEVIRDKGCCSWLHAMLAVIHSILEVDFVVAVRDVDQAIMLAPTADNRLALEKLKQRFLEWLQGAATRDACLE